MNIVNWKIVHNIRIVRTCQWFGIWKWNEGHCIVFVGMFGSRCYQSRSNNVVFNWKKRARNYFWTERKSVAIFRSQRPNQCNFNEFSMMKITGLLLCTNLVGPFSSEICFTILFISGRCDGNSRRMAFFLGKSIRLQQPHINVACTILRIAPMNTGLFCTLYENVQWIFAAEICRSMAFVLFYSSGCKVKCFAHILSIFARATPPSDLP